MKLLIIPALISWSALAHQTWVSVSDYYPSVGDIINVEIGNGHRFFKSEKALPDTIIYSFSVTLPSQKKVDLESQRRGTARETSYRIKMTGTHFVNLELRRPGMDRSVVIARAVLTVGNTSVKTKSDRKNLSIEFDEDTNIIKLWNENKLISGRINIESSRGELYKITVSKKRDGKIQLKKGIYMLTTSKDGQQGSLTFKKR